MTDRDPEITREFVRTRAGMIHYAACGQGPPVLLLHQTPRSWDEYRDVLPLLGSRFRAIAMDTLGFGDSHKPAGFASIGHFAQGVVAFLDALGIQRLPIVGHHTGGNIAVEVAARYPQRVTSLVLSCTACMDAEGRARAAGQPPIDAVVAKTDGSHLTELWQKRSGYYPKDRPDLLHRFVLDALRVLDRVEEGHIAVANYRMEEALPLVKAPVVLICGTDDWASFDDQPRLAAQLGGCDIVYIEGGGVALPDQLPDAFAQTVLESLRRLGTGDSTPTSGTAARDVAAGPSGS